MDDTTVLKYNDVILRASDMDVLEGPCFLNDQIIGFYFSYLSSLCSQDDITFVLPPVSFWLANCDVDCRKDAAEPLKLANQRLVLFTVNDSNEFCEGESGTHWSILIFDRAKNSFLHFDTMQGMNHNQALKLYASVKQFVGVQSTLTKEGGKKKNKKKKKVADTAVVVAAAAPTPTSTDLLFKEWDAPQQTNGYNCGVYVMAIAKAVSDFYLSRRTV